MGWEDISTSVYVPGAQVSNRLFALINNNLVYTYAMCAPHSNFLFNGSWENGSTVTGRPYLWTFTTVGFTGGSITWSTIASHGSRAIIISANATGGGEGYTDYYIPCSTNIIYKYSIITKQITATSILNGIYGRFFTGAFAAVDSSATSIIWQSTAGKLIYNKSTGTFTVPSGARFMKIGIAVPSANTKTGSAYFDGLRIWESS